MRTSRAREPKTKLGRPSKGKGKNLHIRITDAQQEWILKRAAKKHLTISDYVLAEFVEKGMPEAKVLA